MAARPGAVKHKAKGHAQLLNQQIRQEQVLALKIKGLSTTQVAAELGLTPSQVSHSLKRVQAEMAEHRHELGAVVRDLDLQRLDQLQSSIWDKAMNGDIKSVQTCINIISKRQEILGNIQPSAEKRNPTSLNDLSGDQMDLLRSLVVAAAKSMRSPRTESMPVDLKQLPSSVDDDDDDDDVIDAEIADESDPD